MKAMKGMRFNKKLLKPMKCMKKIKVARSKKAGNTFAIDVILVARWCRQVCLGAMQIVVSGVIQDMEQSLSTWFASFRLCLLACLLATPLSHNQHTRTMPIKGSLEESTGKESTRGGGGKAGKGGKGCRESTRGSTSSRDQATASQQKDEDRCMHHVKA